MVTMHRRAANGRPHIISSKIIITNGDCYVDCGEECWNEMSFGFSHFTVNSSDALCMRCASALLSNLILDRAVSHYSEMTPSFSKVYQRLCKLRRVPISA
jgi:hypothetical protein